MIMAYGREFESKEAFGLWLNTAPKNEVMLVLQSARRRAYVADDLKAYTQIDNLIGQIAKEAD